MDLDVQHRRDRLPRRAACVARVEPRRHGAARRRGRTLRLAPRLAAPPRRRRLGSSPLAGRARRPWGDADAVRDLLRGARGRRRAASRERPRPPARRPDDHDLGHARAAGAPPRPDPHRRGGLVPGLQRARRRLRPRRAEDARRQGRRRAGSSPARRCGPRWRSTRSGACSSRAPTPTRRRTPGTHLLPDGHGAGRRGDRAVEADHRRVASSTSCSSTARVCRTRTCSAASATAGRSR